MSESNEDGLIRVESTAAPTSHNATNRFIIICLGSQGHDVGVVYSDIATMPRSAQRFPTREGATKRAISLATEQAGKDHLWSAHYAVVELPPEEYFATKKEAVEVYIATPSSAA